LNTDVDQVDLFVLVAAIVKRFQQDHDSKDFENYPNESVVVQFDPVMEY
jgi:hypothetical protein